MDMQRPDLSNVDEEVVAYIAALEEALAAAGSKPSRPTRTAATAGREPSEPETTVNIITVTSDGLVKRTPRHHYLRQRRGGMGVLDIDTDGSRPATILCEQDAAADVLVITDQGRIFRIAVNSITEREQRARGESLSSLLPSPLLDDETVIAMLAADAGLYVNLVSQRGWVRHVRKTYLGETMTQGIRYHKVSDGGYVVAACWTGGSDDLFLASRSGLGIRFSEKQIPGTGCLGMRLDPSDMIVAAAPTAHDGGILVIGADGKGTIRLMEGFRQNKAPGAGGKVILKTERLVAAVACDGAGDVFAISQTSKLIRFAAEEIPPKTGVVQGVNCMALRADTVTAFIVGALPTADNP